MTTTTGDPSTLKTPASLSGGDLVSRLLAATPPYLYNVPLTPHSFFFSEMLRSFVQAKTEASTIGHVSNTSRRRKRSWRDARDRPLELTTKERSHHHHHHHQQQQQQQPQQQDKYFHVQQHPQQETRLESRGKQNETYDGGDSKNAVFDQKPAFDGDVLKSADESKAEFTKTKSFFEEQPHHFEQAQPPEIFSAEMQKVKPEDQQQVDRKNCNYGERSGYDERSKSAIGGNQELPLLADQKKLDFSRSFLPGLPGRSCEVLQGAKSFGLPGNVSNPEFLPGPLWYPPYPMPQSYPGIDPLHFFIDLRVSGHIWDRKLNERQLPFKSKHCSAFSVPQSKEYSNRPLNLTRDEASASRNISENTRGTNYILKHLTKTYREIQQTKKASKSETSIGETDENSKESNEGDSSPKPDDSNRSSTSLEEERKDLRALIGLELVVDYVKEPKGETSSEQTSQVTE